MCKKLVHAEGTLRTGVGDFSLYILLYFLNFSAIHITSFITFFKQEEFSFLFLLPQAFLQLSS